jgi:hypothetical protein
MNGGFAGTLPMAGSFDNGTVRAAPYVHRRTVEIWAAVAAGLLGAVVAGESLTHDIGWNEAGPGSGYFPFRVGLLLTGAAIVQLLQIRLEPPAFARSAPARPRQSLGEGGDSTAAPVSRLKPDSTPAFVTREEMGRSLGVLWPTVALVAAMFPLGCYVPSAAYLAWMLRRHGRHGWLLSAAYGVAVAAAFFLVFDLWFRVPLAKGPLEAAFGLY